MRIRTLPLLAFAVLLGTTLLVVTRRAEGQDAEDGTARIAALELRVQTLQADVELLRSRERATTEYLLAMGTTAANLRSMTQNARTAGFEMAAIPANSRIELLRGLDQLAGDLSRGLPAPSREEIELRRKAEELRRAAK